MRRASGLTSWIVVIIDIRKGLRMVPVIPMCIVSLVVLSLGDRGKDQVPLAGSAWFDLLFLACVADD